MKGINNTEAVGQELFVETVSGTLRVAEFSNENFSGFSLYVGEKKVAILQCIADTGDITLSAFNCRGECPGDDPDVTLKIRRFTRQTNVTITEAA